MILLIALIIVVVALVILIPQYIKVSEIKKPDKKTIIMYIASTALVVIIREGFNYFAIAYPVIYYSGFSAFLFFLVYSVIKILLDKDFEKDKKSIVTMLACIATVIACLILPIAL